MFIRKIMVLILGFLMSFISMAAMSANKNYKKISVKTDIVQVEKNKKTKIKKIEKEKISKTKNNKPSQKSKIGKNLSKQKIKKTQRVKNTKSNKNLGKKSNKKKKNETKSYYGVKGAKLVPTKVVDKKYSYRAKGQVHTTISKESSRLYSQTGVASYYGGMFHGRKTANGEIFNKNAFTAAHKTLALGSYALVTNLRNGRKVLVKINDRGPFSKNRIIDLSVAAAKEIGMIHSGVARVKIEAMQVDRNGYISGKGAKSLLKLAKKTGLHLKVKGNGNNLAIKAQQLN